MPRLSLVRSLNCVTNWPMLTPCWPSAGPTGGAGVAWPPGHWSLIFAVITLAILGSRWLIRSDAFDLPVFEVDRRRPVEDNQHHLDEAATLDDFLHGAFEVLERSI